MNNWQRDPRWVNAKLGFSDTTIGDFGCTISVIGNVIGIDPTVVNDRLKAVNGFASGNLVIWAKIQEAFPGIKVERVWGYDNAEVLASVPNVIVEVPAKPIGGTGSHWVQYIGNKKLNDPWTGKVRPTGDFPNPTGYAVITGKWKENPPPPTNNDGKKAVQFDRITSFLHSISVLPSDKSEDYVDDNGLVIGVYNLSEENKRKEEQINQLRLELKACENQESVQWVGTSGTTLPEHEATTETSATANPAAPQDTSTSILDRLSEFLKRLGF